MNDEGRSRIWKACEKRPITQAQIDELISNLEDKWTQKKEIGSRELGKIS